MKVLIVGSGGREHALSWKIVQSPAVQTLYAAPGNAGISQIGQCVDVDVEDLEGLADFAQQQQIDLTVVGPEAPLVAGITDTFAQRGLRIYGATPAAARLEASKSFTSELLRKYGISDLRFAIFDEPGPAKAWVRREGAPIVVKADGLAAGKGVKVAATIEEAEAHIDRCMVEGAFGASGKKVIIEECLVGQECSIKVFTDGETVVPMVPSQDYKRIGDGDTGDNTGGMGCYSPVPAVDPETFDYILNRIIKPTVQAMAEEGTPYVGTLYAGCILTDEGPQLLEYNCRFGDPETQVVLPRLETDLVEILQATVEGRLNEIEAQWRDERCVCVVVASGGYPGHYDKGKLISGLAEAEAKDEVVVFHAGTARRDDDFITNGGRVLGVTALGSSFRAARDRAYNAVRLIDFEKMYYRTDIALRAVEAEGT